jgi:hypothetical protein
LYLGGSNNGGCSCSARAAWGRKGEGVFIPPSKCDHWGRINQVKEGGLSAPQIIRGKSHEISAPITGSKSPRVFTGGNIQVRGGRIIRPPDNPSKIPSIFRPHYWEQTTSRLCSFGGGGGIIWPNIRPLY